MKNTLLIAALLLACVACASTVPYCVQYDAAGNCTQCRGGFYLGSDGLCHAQCKGFCTVPNCSQYDDAGNCTQCLGGFYLKGGKCYQQCLRSSSSCAVANCSSCTPTDECLQCRGGFFLKNNTCIPQCKLTNQVNGLCQECHSGFILNHFNTCVQSDLITSAVKSILELFE